ncbi:capsule assembly Wzi family protein, partial [Enterobacter hormaechei]|uniref:capsule assembly Wzi family protein n=1 Tax=Enterobacter hormaechei TaxID=158836 RepID=UPI0013D4E1D6
GYGAAIYNQNIQRIRAGQSSFRLNYKVLSVGISSENLWWGPGIYNSLLMSNNAPGFWHLTFNSRKPLKTPIGDFEWQLIGGKLVEDTS